jgi:hypothetical protein
MPLPPWLPYTVATLATAALLLGLTELLAAFNQRLILQRVRVLEAVTGGLVESLAAGRKGSSPTPADGLPDEVLAAGANGASNALRACRAEHGSIISVGRIGQSCPRCGWLHGPGDHLVARDGDERVIRCNACGGWFDRVHAKPSAL